MRLEFEATGRLGKKGKVDGQNIFVVWENHYDHMRYASVVSDILPTREATRLVGRKAKVTIEIED